MTLLDHLPSLRNAATVRLDPRVWPLTTSVDDLGRLCVGGVPLTDIADEFRTPGYVLDETDFRTRLKRYRDALPGADIVYAGKSLLCTEVARWVADSGAGLDVSSAGELATALVAGTDPARIVMHGNAKSADEIRDAAVVGVGRIVVDSLMDIAYLSSAARSPQRVLVRVAPDIDIHGHVAEAVKRIVAQPLLQLTGLHCHIGSQITDPGLFAEAVRRMIATMADVRTAHGLILTELNLGGGYGVPCVSGDGGLDPAVLADTLDDALDTACAAERFPRPRIVIEPGRSVSARAGVTLYRVVSVEPQAGGRTFVAVDGGMSDNPRMSLYGADHSVALANRHPIGPTRRVTIAGRHCEAGDEIARDVELPADIHAGDLLAVAATGAYHHSMASNYTMVTRPPIVAVRRGLARELVRRETLADLLARDRGWSNPRPDNASGCEALLHGE
jgi:diaminopimelate decarboxylase